MATKTKTINLALIPPVAHLRLALIGVVDARFDEMMNRLNLPSTDKLRRLAIIARELSRKHCFFCGAASDPLMKKADKLEWKDLPLCACLSKDRSGYREYFPRWKDRKNTIMEMVEKWLALQARGVNPESEPGALAPTKPIYSNNCTKKVNGQACGTYFIITAGMIARRMRNGKCDESHLCKRHALEAKAKRAVVSTEKPSHATVPAKKRPQKVPAPKLATIGEQVAAKQKSAADHMAELNQMTQRAAGKE